MNDFAEVDIKLLWAKLFVILTSTGKHFYCGNYTEKHIVGKLLGTKDSELFRWSAYRNLDLGFLGCQVVFLGKGKDLSK
jgi:hypothetical protein